MFEKFSDRSRKCVQLATQEAGRLNHEYTGPEHLLVGLIKEGHGVAAHVLTDFGLTVNTVQSAIETPADQFHRAATGRPAYTDELKKVFGYANDQAAKLGHGSVGTEHLLLGILVLGGGLVFDIFRLAGIQPERVREEILNLLEYEDDQGVVPAKESPESPEPPERHDTYYRSKVAGIKLLLEEGDAGTLEKIRKYLKED